MSSHLQSFYFFLISFFFFLCTYSPAAIIRVPQDQPGIQAGINAAVNGDTVLVADSTYYENINFLGKAITVASYYILDGDTNHINSTIINGSQPTNPNAASVVSFVAGEDTNSVITGFTITGGTGTITGDRRIGGGIYCYSSGCKIVHNKIIGNTLSFDQKSHGGGIGSWPTSNANQVLIRNNIIESNSVFGNEVAKGGGIFLIGGSIIDNLIRLNTCIANLRWSQGGGIAATCDTLIFRSTVIIRGNTITENMITSNSTNYNYGALGGGVDIQWNTVLMDGNIVSHNTINTGSIGFGVGARIYGAGNNSTVIKNNISFNSSLTSDCDGGGLGIAETGFISLHNNLLSGNTVNQTGGGIYMYNTSPVEIINNTILGNTTTSGGGIYIQESNAYIMNTIIWDNQAPINPAIYSYNSTIDVVYSDVQGGWPGNGNISKEPMLRGEYSVLSDSSSCIGAGTLSYQFGPTTVTCPPTCFLGNARPSPSGSNPDIGTCESLLDGPVVGLVKQLPDNLPVSYVLKQNYPNPFNPVTTIGFQLSAHSFVSLRVYDITGREVATLVSENLPLGNYQYEWDATELASGVYFYQLQAGNFIQTKKMLLLQ